MRSPPRFAQIEIDLRSDHQETRGRAVQDLLMSAKKDPRVHQAALPLFQTMLVTAPDSWTVTNAARGVELIQGPAEGRKAWLTLLNHPSDQIAAGAALTVDAAVFTTELRQLLVNRPEPRIQIAVIRALGQTRDPEFLPTILPYLNQPATRSHAIMALEQLEDPRALTSLEPLIQDDSDSGITDDRGWPLRIGDLAAGATRRLQYVTGKKYPPVMTPAAKGSPVPKPGMTPASTLPPVDNPPVSITKKFQFLPRLLAYIPLIAALVEIPWVAMLVFAQLFLTGAVARTRVQTHSLDALSLGPPLIGLAAALLVITRRPAPRRVETICLSIGSALCALMAIPFAWELFH